MPEHPDRQYPDPDLVKGFIVRRKVKTFHVADPDNLESGLTACGLTLADMIEAGWARGLRRRGLSLCQNCAAGVDLDASQEEE
jgi:hypothetical protein